MDVAVGCSRPLTSGRSHPLNSGRNDIAKIELDFLEKTIEDGVGPEILHCTRRFLALECRFAGYYCDDVRLISISPHSTCQKQVKIFAINSIAVHGSKAICVVIRRKDVDKACIGPFYRGYPKEDVMYGLTFAIMSDVADLPEPPCSAIGRPYSVVSVNDFRGESAHEPSCDVEKTIGFLNEKMMKASCSEYTSDITIETAISAFKLLCCPEELTANDLYVCVCEDIELAPYSLMPKAITGFLEKCSS